MTLSIAPPASRTEAFFPQRSHLLFLPLMLTSASAKGSFTTQAAARLCPPPPKRVAISLTSAPLERKLTFVPSSIPRSEIAISAVSKVLAISINFPASSTVAPAFFISSIVTLKSEIFPSSYVRNDESAVAIRRSAPIVFVLNRYE